MFISPTSAKVHGDTHLAVKSFSCPLRTGYDCSKTFAGKQEAATHGHAHSGAKPCPYPHATLLGCSKTFASKTRARQHTKTCSISPNLDQKDGDEDVPMDISGDEEATNATGKSLSDPADTINQRTPRRFILGQRYSPVSMSQPIIATRTSVRSQAQTVTAKLI